MTRFEIVQVSALSPHSYCYRCKHLLRPGQEYEMVYKDLRKPGWSSFNRRLKADHTMALKAHKECPK